MQKCLIYDMSCSIYNAMVVLYSRYLPLVAVDFVQFMHVDLKYKAPLVFESWGNNRKSAVDLI